MNQCYEIKYIRLDKLVKPDKESIVPIDESILNFHYLYYYLKTREFLKNRIFGTVISQCVWRDYYSIIIPVPQLDEQNRIIKVMSSMEKKIEQTQKGYNTFIDETLEVLSIYDLNNFLSAE